MNQTTELSALSPVEHDLLFLERLQNRSKAQHDLYWAGSALVRHYGKVVRVLEKYGDLLEEVTIDYRTDPVPTKAEDAVPLTPNSAEALYNEGVPPKYGSLASVAGDASKYESARLAYEDASIAVDQCNDEYARRKWDRYWLVTSSDGHIHASTECSTCNKGLFATGFALVPYLSGAGAKDAVADLGSALCSVCFPDAPVEDREQVKISARVALVLSEQGVGAFQQARAKAQADAQKRASERCEGSGTSAVKNGYWYTCPTCGYSQRQHGKVRAHRRPRWYAVKEVGYNTRYWDGAQWAPSTKKVDLLTKAQALAIVNAHGGDGVRSE